MSQKTELEYITQYGEELGKQRYQNALKRRIQSLTRRTSNGQIICQVCGKKFKRITHTHLMNSCIEKNTLDEYRIKFPDAELVPPELKMLCKSTLASMIEKYGEELGKEKWKHYCDLQALTNTFEYKAEKYNISKEEFKEYNKSRAATLENLIRRHGEEDGLKRWDSYCEKQRYTTSIEYFIEKYGVENGTNKYQNFCYKRSENKGQSAIELAAYNELQNLLPDLELSIRLDNIYYGPYDYGNINHKRLIEFYGSYWHADPRFFDADHFFFQKTMTASEIWSRDQAKRTYAINNGFQIFIIWEHDWYKNKLDVIHNITEWWNAK